jgi:phosphoribosylformylglycinamidine synthase
MDCGAHRIRTLYSFIFVDSKQNSMTYSVHINIMPLKELLDPQGKAVLGGLNNLGLNAIEDVRIGKHISLQVDAASKEEASKIAEEATKKLLANAVMESYEISVD